MASQPNYSLIIPHYNIPKLLGRLLKSVPFREDLQVIVIDDCSNKNLKEFSELKRNYPWIEWYSTNTNGGGGKARNIGISKAKGKYLIFADADDYFETNINEILDLYSTFDEDLIILNIRSEIENSNVNRVITYQNYIRDYEENIPNSELNVIYGYLAPWAKFVSRKLIEKKKIRCEETAIHNDALFSAEIAVNAKSIIIDSRIFYILTEQENSTSKKVNLDNLVVRYKTFNTINKLYKHNGIKIFCFNEYRALIDLLKRKQILKVISCLRQHRINFCGFSYLMKYLKSLLH